MKSSPLGTRFEVGLTLRIAVLLGAGAALAWAINQPGLYATTLLAAIVTGAALAELWLFVRRTNFAVARFVEALAHDDFTQGFVGAGGGFGALADSLNGAIGRLRAERAAIQDDNRYLAALVDDVPSPLVSIDGDDRVVLVNKAARRLLSPTVARLDDLAIHGADFQADMAAMRPGERRATRLLIGGAPTAALLSMAEVRQARGSIRVVAIQPIQAELDRAELAAQTDLVRVLTHEIMNSMTPVTSLSATAAQLIAAADKGDDPAIADARAAIETVARRSEGVMHFVRTYRQLTRPPELHRRPVDVSAMFAELKRLFESDWPNLPLAVAVAPPGLRIDIDPDLVAQLLINLLRNAAAAVADVAAPAVRLEARALKGGRTAIDVIDNGTGVPEALRQDIFLPFFTTKADGTGVGLSLARQIALAHGGALTCEPAPAGGTQFRLLV
ncbi:sensor histidine kinase [Polymorphobacter fuscus]|uniref:histidine kinase n=1 Tax=Sandarakinorhabdus fusca TaxID=1439888 RepID=A0A7C9GQE2_9SPHN|nr:ATP-binding protein [Polymorphobacter fuscus]KAB7644430.1 PAS domain-containing protein [Polymorphobacter fuscus]MQT18352.1 PAS domain-containing protein [Polymorphobacter fuscus]NJC08252.1 signal transduction histidine kinase [Polymorphobacter fuscus]